MVNSYIMRKRNAAHAKNTQKRGTSTAVAERQQKSTLSPLALGVLLFVVVGSGK
jgi:hypothetical protein